MSSSADPEHVQFHALRAIQLFVDAMDHTHGTMTQLMGLNASDLRALRAMSIKQLRVEDVTPQSLAEHLSMSSAATTALIRRLTSHGFLESTPHPTDRRSQILVLTESARKTFQRHFEPHRQTMQAVIAQYSAEQLASVTQFMDHMAQQLNHPDTR